MLMLSLDLCHFRGGIPVTVPPRAHGHSERRRRRIGRRAATAFGHRQIMAWLHTFG